MLARRAELDLIVLGKAPVASLHDHRAYGNSVMRLAKWFVLICLICAASAAYSALQRQQGGTSFSQASGSSNIIAYPPASICSMDIRFQDRQTLGPLLLEFQPASGFPCGQASNGNLAALVDFASVPTHGIVLSEASGLHLVAGGCPSGFGCGDPTPIGGNFSTMFHIGENVPSVNARGDVLFLSDVEGGTSSRGLFFYDRTSQTVQKVAAIGDPTPNGGVFGSIGLGSINDSGEAVFLAWRNSIQDGMILRWKAGVIQVIVATGDPGPNGSVFVATSFMWFGTPQVPGWAPHIREDGHAFFLAAANTAGNRGLYEEYNGQITRLVGSQDPAPGGGVFNAFGVPIPNENGEIAFSAEQVIGNSHPGTWFRGRPGLWERVLAIGDVIDGRVVVGITGSKGPHCNPFDDAGNLLLPVVLRNQVTNVNTTAILLARRGLAPRIVLQVGDSCPLGQITQLGTFTPMTTTSIGAVAMEVSTPMGLVDAHALIDICVAPDALTYCTAKANSAGCLPRISASGIPSASANAGFVVQADQVLNARPGVLLYGVSGGTATPFGGGTLCMMAPVKRAITALATGTPAPAVDCSGVFRLDMNAFSANRLGGTPAPALSIPGTTVDCQWYGRDPGFAAPSNIQLSDGVQYRVTP
jgi:hypothetical protein